MSTIYAANQIRLNAVDLIQQASDPSSGGGVAAAIGSFYLRNGTAQAWLKTGAGNTNWGKLVQSFNWYSVLDYGARGDNANDDTSAIQGAINACATDGGGVVFFPPGTYKTSQITINAQSNVQLAGSGSSSVIKWSFNAGAAAGSLLALSAGSSRCKISNLKFDGSGLTNPAASRNNHLVSVDGTAGGVTELQIMRCTFGGMVAASGDGINVVGAAGNLVSRIWVAECVFDGCSRNSTNFQQGYQYAWIVENYMTNCDTEIMLVATADVNADSVIVQGNEINHTSATRWAMRYEGGATTLITKLIVAANVVIGGFATLNNAQYVVTDGNTITSGAFASTDPVLRIFGNVLHTVVLANFIDRDPAASVGPCITLEKATNSPIYVRVGQNLLVNETTGGQFIKCVDITSCSIGGNLCRSTNGDASVAFGIDVQAVTVAATNLLIGPGNQMTAGAGSFKAGVRLLCNGANVTDVSVAGNQGVGMDYGVQFEIGGGGGTFNGKLFYGGNNLNSSVGDHNDVGVTIRPNIGLNAGTFGAQLISGTGAPEGVVTARIGSIYLRTDGGQATAVYYKESGTGNTGWFGIGGSMITFGAADTTTAATAVFLGPGFIATALAAELQIAVDRPGTIRNLRVQVATGGTTVDTVTYTVRKNGVDTALVATIDNQATGGATDLSDTFTVIAGDLLSVKVTKAGVVVLGQGNVTATVELV